MVFIAGFTIVRIVERKVIPAVIAVAENAILDGTSSWGCLFFMVCLSL